MQLYNTLSGTKEPFAPADGNTVRMYVCGITPYDTTHMGHAMTYLTFDVINRLCQHLGWRVKYVQNVTDIDDDILRKANELNERWDLLGDRNIRQFHEDLNALNILPMDVFPRASEEAETIVEMCQKLIASGNAYEVDGTVYYRVASYPDYGKLSKYETDVMHELLGERGGDPSDTRKEAPLDFVLWQAAQPGEPTWDSPWGKGRPGWHIECSAMAYRYLGPQIDIHGGGGDLMYPHHESEIAQSECFTGLNPFSQFWVHVAMVRYENEKMSKSLGNMVFVREVLRTQTPDALRLYLHSNHYRDEFDYLDDGPSRFEQLAKDLKNASRIDSDDEGTLDLQPISDEFFDALKDDLNTPVAVQILGKMASEVIEAAVAGDSVGKAQDQLRVAASMFGLQGTR
ncbi:MAG: cysteine--tRNA ligase [Sphaerobacteraceae bacterium]|nr:MAG: cysteine--tRNA ligase [Sphaerobacteraceae bacterium]